MSCNNDVELTEQDWSYVNDICKVEFSLKNNDSIEAIRKIRIIAHRQKDIGKGAVVNKIKEKKTITLKLMPSEEKTYIETINLIPNSRPSMVVVSQTETE